MSEGWVYVLSNKSLKGQLKIGYSTVSPKTRAKDLDTTGVPTPFSVEYEIKVRNCEALEKQVHQKLSKNRVRKGREFFKIDIPTAISVIQELADNQQIEDNIYYKSPEEIRFIKAEREQYQQATARERELNRRKLEYKDHVNRYLDFCDSNLIVESENISSLMIKKLRQSSWPFSSKRDSGKQKIKNFKQEFWSKKHIFRNKFEQYLLQNPKFFELYNGTRFHFSQNGDAVRTRPTFTTISGQDPRFCRLPPIPPVPTRQTDITCDFRLGNQFNELSDLTLVRFYESFLRNFGLKISDDFTINHKNETSHHHYEQQKGFRRINFANGDRYEGECTGHTPDGKGKLFYASGKIAQGNFVNGMLEGVATVWVPERGVYSGEFRNGNPIGSLKKMF